MLKTDSLNARTHSLTHSFTSSSCFLSLFLGGYFFRFEATPSGRLLNRFSSDLAAVDTEVMDELYTMVDNAATFVAIVVVVIASYWALLVVMVPVVVLSVSVGAVYQRSSQGK